MEELRKQLTIEFSSKNAKENPQILITVLQILCGLLIGGFCSSITSIADSLKSNFWVVGLALILCVVLPLSTKIKVLCSSKFLQKSSFFIFSISVGIVLAFVSLYFLGLFFAVWMYLATALLLFYEYNGITKVELRESFKFVVTGLVIISVGFELVVLCNFDIIYFFLIVFVI